MKFKSVVITNQAYNIPSFILVFYFIKYSLLLKFVFRFEFYNIFHIFRIFKTYSKNKKVYNTITNILDI